MATADNSSSVDYMMAELPSVDEIVDYMMAESRYLERLDAKLLDAAGRSYPTCLHPLVRRGAALDARDVMGKTPLHLAAEANQFANVVLLLRLGADVMLKDDTGRWPVTYCGDQKMVRYMLAYAHRAGVDMEVTAGVWAADVNLEHRKMVRLSELLERSIEIMDDGFAPHATVMYAERLLQQQQQILLREDVLRCYVQPDVARKLRCVLRGCWDIAQTAAPRHKGGMMDKCHMLDQLRLQLLQLPPSCAKFAACAQCGLMARVKRCATCATTTYCSRACQAAAWPAHKAACVAPREEVD